MMIARKLDPALGAFRHRAGIVGLERSDRIGNRLQEIAKGTGGH